MLKISPAGCTLLLAFLLAGCVSSETPPSSAPPAATPPAAGAGEDRTILGTVAALDLEPMSYDGDAVVTVQVPGGALVRVYVPARMNLCEADFSGFDGLEFEDVVAVRGAVTEDGGVRPCESADHYFRSP